MTCEQRSELFPLLLTGALEPEERAALERHLATGCVTCAANLAAARATFELVGRSLKPVAPPAEAWERLQTRIELASQMNLPGEGRAAPQSAVPLAAPRAIPRRRSMVPLVLLGLATAAAVAVAVVLGLQWNDAQTRLAAALHENDDRGTQLADVRTQLATLNTRLTSLQTQLDTASSDNRRMLVQLQTQQTDADKRLQGLLRAEQFAGQGKEQPAIQAKLFWDHSANGWTLFASNVKPLPADKTYELWIITAAGEKLAAGTATPDATGNLTMTATLPANTAPAAAALTDEPAPGGPVPQGSVQLLVPLTSAG